MDYCSRNAMEEKVLTKLDSGNNLALIRDRRIGKTSTAHHMIDKIKKVYKVDVDLYHIVEASDIAETIIDACKRVK